MPGSVGSVGKFLISRPYARPPIATPVRVFCMPCPLEALRRLLTERRLRRRPPLDRRAIGAGEGGVTRTRPPERLTDAVRRLAAMRGMLTHGPRSRPVLKV